MEGDDTRGAIDAVVCHHSAGRVPVTGTSVESTGLRPRNWHQFPVRWPIDPETGTTFGSCRPPTRQLAPLSGPVAHRPRNWHHLGVPVRLDPKLAPLGGPVAPAP